MNIALENRIQISVLVQFMQIFMKYLHIFKLQIHNERLPGENCYFLAFFSKQDLKFLYNKFQVSLTSRSGFSKDKSKNTTIFDSFDTEKHLAQHLGNFAPSKKGLNIIGSKMGFTFGHFFQTLISLISLLALLCIVALC